MNELVATPPAIPETRRRRGEAAAREGRGSMTDVDRCAVALVSRCAFLVTYHHGPTRRRTGQAGMAFELEWLAADARRWGVPVEVIASGVRAELDRLHDRETARGLFAV